MQRLLSPLRGPACSTNIPGSRDFCGIWPSTPRILTPTAQRVASGGNLSEKRFIDMTSRGHFAQILRDFWRWSRSFIYLPACCLCGHKAFSRKCLRCWRPQADGFAAIRIPSVIVTGQGSWSRKQVHAGVRRAVLRSHAHAHRSGGDRCRCSGTSASCDRSPSDAKSSHSGHGYNNASPPHGNQNHPSPHK